MSIINLISGPRNISTALMYSFASRSDTCIIDEPFYGYYLKQSDSNHPGKEEILASMECDWNKIIDNILETKKNHSIVFIKNMAHHHIHPDLSFLERCINVYLIRNPTEIINSFAKVIDNPTLADLGCEKQRAIFKLFPGVVIDSNEVLKNPKAILSLLCSKIDISFQNEMLSWKAGERSEDGVWAKYWYKSVHESTNFKKWEPKSLTLKEDLLPLLNEALPHFNQLYKHALKAAYASKI